MEVPAPPLLTVSLCAANPGPLSCGLSPKSACSSKPGPWASGLGAFFPSSRNEGHLSLWKPCSIFQVPTLGQEPSRTTSLVARGLFYCPSLVPPSQNLLGVLVMPPELFPECQREPPAGWDLGTPGLRKGLAHSAHSVWWWCDGLNDGRGKMRKETRCNR